jgi:hypothetical protein
MTKALAILISPTGEEFFHAYGPMTKRRDKATRFINGSVAIKGALSYLGRGNNAFWESERRSENAARERYKGWSYRVEEVGADDDDRSLWRHLARNEKVGEDTYRRLYVRIVDGQPEWTEDKDLATEWPDSLTARKVAAEFELPAFDFSYS